MSTSPLDILSSNKFCSFSVNSEEEIQKIFVDFQKKIEKSKMKKKLQSKIFKWFSELNSKERKIISTIQNKYLTEIFSQLNSLYKKDNNIKFEPTGDMLLLFEGYSPKIEKIEKEEVKNDKAKNSQNSLSDRKISSFNDEGISNNKKEDRERNITNTLQDGNESLVNYFSIVKNNMSKKEEKNKNENRIRTEEEFLIFFNRISSDENIITISDELLSNFEQFKKFFLFFSNSKCFKEWLFPKEKNGVKYFTLPSWISTNNDYFTLCEIYVAFFEQRILFFYEYFLHTNRIYKSKYENNKILELDDEINNIVGQLNKESNYFDKIFSQGIIKDICNKNNINNESCLTIFNELKSYMKNSYNEKEKIIKLLKMVTFLKCENFDNDKILFYNSYKKYILDFLENEITQELIIEDEKSQIYKNDKQNKKNNNKKYKNKLSKKEVIENQNIKKEEEKIEKKEENNNENNEKSNRDENPKNEDTKNEIKENVNKIVDEKRNKKNKECFLFLNNLNNKKDKAKKNKKKNKNNENKKNKNENKINSNEDLIRITSTTSLSTYKSSNYQEDQFSNYDNDSLSINSDISSNNDNKIINSSSKETTEINKYNKISKNNSNNNQNNYNSQSKYININNNIIINIQNNYNNNNINNNNYITNNAYNYNIQNNYNNINYYNNNYNSQNYYNTKNNNNIKINNNNSYNSQIYNNIIPTNNTNNVFYNIFQKNIYYNNQYYNYYDQGIMNYYEITKSNLVILDHIKNDCIEYIINIIKENLDKKYNLKFGKYGSHFTGLSIEGSDIDICIIYKKLLEDDLIFQEELYDILFKNENKSKKFSFKTKKIFTARIPRIVIEIDISEEIKKNPLNNSFKYLDDKEMNTVKIDLTFNENEDYLVNNMKNVEYIKNTLKEYPEIKQVILILKRYLKIQNMNEVYLGGIGSYELFLMVLNVIKSYQKLSPNTPIRKSQLLIITFEKFSFFDFSKNGIGKDNYDYLLEEENSDAIPFILNPLTGKNVAQYGSCRGEDIKNTFLNGYKLLFSENNTFRYYFGKGFYPFNQCPLNSIANLFKVEKIKSQNGKFI